MRTQYRVFPGAMALLVVLLSGCGDHIPAGGSFEREISVTGLLLSKQPHQIMHVFYTTDRVAEVVAREEVFAADAEVMVSGGGQTVRFHAAFNDRGQPHFIDVPDTLRVIPGETYRLTVRSDAGVLEGCTTVPAAFAIHRPAPGDSLRLSEPFTFRWTESETARGYLIYIYRPPVEIPITPDSILIARPQEMFGSLTPEIEIPGYVFRETGKHLLFVLAYDENFFQHAYQNRNTSGLNGGYGLFAAAAMDTLHFWVAE